MELSPQLSKILGVDRVQSLLSTLRAQAKSPPQEHLSTILVCGAILISAIPILGFFWFKDRDDIDLITFMVGLAACLSVIYRVRVGITFPSVKDWKTCFKHIHTAFALGCIPFVLILAFFPEMLQTIVQEKGATAVSTSAQSEPTMRVLILFILGVSVWAGLTEEVIYRGLLISVLRRWHRIPTQKLRDIFAIFVSAFIFGLGHLPLWGPGMSLALVGLGLGLGVAYITIGEKLLPLIVYHIIFDALSLSISVFVLK